uniref:Reverse transcriptase Ty1/copia-type domain-containing protein n=1 Tax=Tanacetum cinerariifolium TaxID=118510 RepID=A0A6L2NC10_TANCI|nr:hypothetical protein [Tanacetum cinerariifolium]
MIEYSWIEAMQEQIHEFDLLEVWELVPRPDRVMIISLKWIFKVKLDEYGGVLKNKARLVAKAYVAHKNMVVFQMDVKTTCLNEVLKEEVHVAKIQDAVHREVHNSLEKTLPAVMSSSPYSTIVPSDSGIKNTFSSTNSLNYFSASPGSISPDSSNDFTKYLLDILVFLPLHDDSKMEVIQAYDAIPPPQEISPKDTETPIESPIPVPPSSSEGSSSPVSIAAALEEQAANMANTNNTNRNTGTSRTPVARKGTNDHKRKFVDRRNTTTNNDNNYSNNCSNNNYRDNHKNHNRNNDYHQQQNRRQDKKYHGNLPLCTRCTLHHTGVCTIRCQTCNMVGHRTRNYISKGPATGSNL